MTIRRETKTVCEMSDLFDFCMKYGVTSNQASDIFFSSDMLAFRSLNEKDLIDLREELDALMIASYENCTDNYDKSHFLLVNFMEHHKLQSVTIDTR